MALLLALTVLRASLSRRAQAFELVWEFATHEPILGAPLVAEDRVYFGSCDGTFRCLNRLTGAVVWTQLMPLPVRATPIIAEEVVYVGADDYRLHALDARTGQPVWSGLAAGQTNGPIQGAAAVVGDNVYVGSDDGNLYAFKRSTGEQSRSPFPLTAFSCADLTVKDGLLLLGAGNGAVHILDIASWQARQFYADAAIHTPVAPTPTGAVVGSDDGRLYEIDLAAADVVREFPTGGPVRSVPLVVGGRVYFGSNDGWLRAVDLGVGAAVWEIRTGGAVRSRVALRSGVVYFGSDDGKLRAVADRVPPKLLATFRTGGPISSGPVLAGDLLYFGSWDGKLRAVRTSLSAV